MRKRKLWPWAAVLTLAAAAGVASWQRQTAGADVTFETVRVARGTLDRTVVATGVIRPVVGAEVDVGSRISGQVVDLRVKVGDAVDAGDLLARIDATGIDARVDQATADLALARAELTQAESACERRRRLAGEGIVPTADLDLAVRDLEVARARVDSAAAELRGAEIDRGYTRITAPIRGVIAEVTTREGETVAASFASPTFVTIVDLDRLEVQAYVDETDVGRVFVGQTAAFTVDTYPEVELAATVTAIRPQAEIQSSVVNYVVLLAFAGVEGAVLRPEMTAHVRLRVDRRDDVLTVPRATLRRRDGRQYADVERHGVWVEQEIRTGWRTDGAVEVVDGLAEGETVRVNPE